MAYKQDTPFNGFPLPDWQVVEASGSDAAAFLQAQSMNDVRALALGHWQWNGWLNPKGRVIALFGLVAVEAERYWLIVPDFPAAELVSRLQRFVFRSKLALRVRDESMAYGAFARPQQAQGSEAGRPALFDAAVLTAPALDSVAPDAEIIELDLGADDGPRTLRIASCNTAYCATEAAASENQTARWAAFDLAHGLPRLPADQSEHWTPQMLSLDRLDAYSLKKGCYPGQEIVARTHYLGQAKRGLVRLSGSGLSVGAEVDVAGRTLGNIVSRHADEALAVLSVDRPASGWECAGSACRELPLRNGLAR